MHILKRQKAQRSELYLTIRNDLLNISTRPYSCTLVKSLESIDIFPFRIFKLIHKTTQYILFLEFMK